MDVICPELCDPMVERAALIERANLAQREAAAWMSKVIECDRKIEEMTNLHQAGAATIERLTEELVAARDRIQELLRSKL